MLRVWGGGYYETDEFYRLCDNLGIMVWQDFMFACGYYPDRGFFLKEVEKEAREVIKRLRNHPSLVLWCGNNEIDWMHYTARLGQGRKFYGREIYHKLLPRLIVELDTDIPYIPTTPLGDSNSFKNNKALTTHRWDVWTDYKPVRDYMNRPEDIAPFVTEFGLQSMPSMKMVGDFCGCENPRIASAEVERHNYQTDGSSRLYRYVSDLFGPVREPEKFVYFSQLTQARAAKLYVEHLRANNRINNGCLFWHFNDSFPAIDWAAIDFNKDPKALYYYAKRFFAPVLITVSYDLQRQKFNQSQLLNPTTIVLVNDSSEQITATVKCRLVDLRGNILDQVTFPISASPFSIVQTMKLPKAISRPTNPERCVLHLILEKADEGPHKAAAQMKVENTVVFLPDKYIDWPRTQVQKQLIRLENRLWKLILKTDAFVKDLKVSCCDDTVVSSECQMMHWAEPVRLSDNFLDIFPDSEKEIIIKVGQKVSLSAEGIKIDFDMINARRIIKD
jgi:beta-mannosidase